MNVSWNAIVIEKNIYKWIFLIYYSYMYILFSYMYIKQLSIRTHFCKLLLIFFAKLLGYLNYSYILLSIYSLMISCKSHINGNKDQCIFYNVFKIHLDTLKELFFCSNLFLIIAVLPNNEKLKYNVFGYVEESLRL